MGERHPDTPYRRAGKLLSLVRDLSTFCKQHQHGDLAGGMTIDEVLEIEHQLADALQWVRQLGAGRAPKARAVEPMPEDAEFF